MSDLYFYLGPFFSHWWSILVGGLWFGLDIAMTALVPAFAKQVAAKISGSNRYRLEAAALAAGVFVAGFLAWQDEYPARLAAERDRDTYRTQASDYRQEIERNVNQTSTLKSQIDVLEHQLALHVNEQGPGFIAFDQSVLLPDFLQVGKVPNANIYFYNAGPRMVSGIKMYGAMYLASGTSSIDFKEKMIQDNFISQVKKENARKNINMTAPGKIIWASLTDGIPVSESDNAKIKSGYTIIFLISHISWDGNPKGITECQWIQPPQEVPIPKDMAVFHECSAH